VREKESRFNGIHPFGTFFPGPSTKTRQSYQVDGLFPVEQSPFKKAVKKKISIFQKKALVSHIIFLVTHLYP